MTVAATINPPASHWSGILYYWTLLSLSTPPLRKRTHHGDDKHKPKLRRFSNVVGTGIAVLLTMIGHFARRSSCGRSGISQWFQNRVDC